MAKFELKKSTTVAEFAAAFNEAFGAQVRVYNGRSRTEGTELLGDLGLTTEGTFSCRGNLTAGRFIERMESEFGLKVKVYTCVHGIFSLRYRDRIFSIFKRKKRRYIKKLSCILIQFIKKGFYIY